MSERPRTAASTLGDVAGEAAAPRLTDLTLSALRTYRRKLADEEDRVSYWRRLVHARIDVLEAETSTEGPLSLETLARVLGDTGAGRTRTALVRVSAAEPLPELPVLAQMWVTEVDPADAEAVASAVDRLRTAERQLTSYRTALHQRIDEATAELITRYRQNPASALVAIREGGAPPREGRRR
jgi:hypothetical protein